MQLVSFQGWTKDLSAPLYISECSQSFTLTENVGRGLCILRGPSGEHIVDVVPGGTELEPQVKTGSWAGRYTRGNPHVKCTGVNNADPSELY